MNYKKLGIILLSAAILAFVIRTFFLETIRVTTPAMSDSQQVGNRLMVEKLTVGARLPMSIGFPFVPNQIMGLSTYFPTFKNAHRIPGAGKIKRNDLVVFNYPVMDGEPIDRHTILLSRCVGIPGDLVDLKGDHLYINDVEVKRPVDAVSCYRYPMSCQEKVDDMLKTTKINQKTYEVRDSGYVYLTKYQFYNLIKRDLDHLAIELKPCFSTFDEKTDVIPYKDFRIELNNRSFRIWGEIINKYEDVKLIRTESGQFRKNGKEADYYIFKQNYYWVLNDHQGYLDDSRSLGLIPESHILGRAFMVLFSPKTKRFLQKI